MKYIYELACKEEGLPESTIEKIRQVYDTSRKQRQYEQTKLNYYKLEFLPIGTMIGHDGEIGNYQITGDLISPEEHYERKVYIQTLTTVLSRISDEEKKFILECYEYESDYIKRLSESYGVSRKAIRFRKNKILDKIRKLFFEELGEE